VTMDDGPFPVKSQAIVTAYILAAIAMLVPIAVVGSTFAAVVLWRRGLRGHGAAVFALGIACAAIAVMALR
jgi:hypothetical protein